MEPDLKQRKYLFYILFPLLSLVMVGFAISFQNKGAENVSEDVQGESIVKILPDVVSLHPTVALEGAIFEYRLTIVDADTPISQINVELVEAPEWAYLKEGFVISGVPTMSEDNVAKFLLKIDDGENSIEEKFYILIVENE